MSGPDLSFATKAEVRSHIQNEIRQGRLKQKPFYYLDGRELTLNPLEKVGYFSISHFFTPLAWDGSLIRQMKEGYETNELGFIIAVSFFLSTFWLFGRYRHLKIKEQQKRFIYQ